LTTFGRPKVVKLKIVKSEHKSHQTQNTATFLEKVAQKALAGQMLDDYTLRF
jgi:hypothetical protein